MKHIYFTVTNDLNYDQRMHRICHSLASHGFKITLVGRELPTSLPLQTVSFEQKRIRCFFKKGFLFYKEYNLRLFFYLLQKKMDGICAIDLDTILPCYFISVIKRIPRIYDAHEYFTEMKEVRTRRLVKSFWTFIEKFAVPRFKYGYTVGDKLAEVFNNKYRRNFIAIKNFPVLNSNRGIWSSESYLYYGGAVNEARGFEYLIPAMKSINYQLIIAGDGNFMGKLKVLIQQNNISEKIELKGMLPPAELRNYAEKATLGIALAEKQGLNQFLALPNKFLDYIHAGIPQITMNYPEYQEINNHFKVAVLIDDLSPNKLSETINQTMKDKELLEEMHRNTLKAKEIYNWQNEEKKLINFYNQIFS
ncbi:MAG TPA: glycosyltransferase [Chitinophagaceae bacterium]